MQAIHIFPSEDSYKENQGSVGADDLVLVPYPLDAANVLSTLTQLKKDIAQIQKDIDASPQTEIYVTEAGKVGSGWYRIWSNGLIEQWGSHWTKDARLPSALTFMRAFSDTSYAFFVCPNNDFAALDFNYDSTSFSFGTSGKTTTSITPKIYGNYESNHYSGCRSFTWYAVGF